MGLQLRDDRQMKALTGLSQDPCDHWLPFFSALDETTQQKTDAEGVASGTRRRNPGGGSQGKLPTMAEKLPFVLYSYKTYPTFDVLGTHCAMARSKAHENLHKLSPRLLLDSRVVDLPMAHNPTFVILSSLKPLFFNSLKNELRSSDNFRA